MTDREPEAVAESDSHGDDRADAVQHASADVAPELFE